MAFQLDARNIPRIEDYAAALKRWHSIKPWRGHAECDPRPLDQHNLRKRHVTIHFNEHRGNAIMCRLHDTDVVTYEPDGRVIINPSSVSQSTNAFANAVLPPGVILIDKVVWTGWGTLYYWHDNPDLRGWNTKGEDFAIQRNLDGQWMPCEEPEPFVKRFLNQKRAAIALKRCNYADFRVWRMAYLAIDQGKHRNEWLPRYDILLALASREMWSTLAYSHELKTVREKIYTIEKCYDFIEVPFLTSYTQLGDMWNGVRPSDSQFRKGQDDGES